jgi:hypothetical protein
MALGKVDQWYINKHQDLARIAGLDDSYSTLLFGNDCCSPDTISFHYVEHLETRVLYNVRHALLENPDMTDNELKTGMLKEWPTEFKDLGGYSRGLPDEMSQEEWEPLLAVMRKISSRSTQMEC